MISGTVKAANGSRKAQETRSRCFGHVMQRDEGSCERQIMEMEVDGRRRGRPKTRWKNCTVPDSKEKNVYLRTGRGEGDSSNSDPV